MPVRNKGSLGNHKNSLDARAARDPELRRKLSRGRARARADSAAFETWARGGCTAFGYRGD